MDVLDLVNDNNQVGPGHDYLVRPFVCKFGGCDRAFARKSDLARHFRIHTNERPFVCHYRGCGKAFIQRSALTVHTRVHTGERPHHCETCNKAFADSSSLARHRRIHTGKRPYGCKVPGCGRQFARRNTYLKHFKRQHPDLPPPTTSSVRALHMPQYRPPGQPFINNGVAGTAGANGGPGEYGAAASSAASNHAHPFPAAHQAEGAAYAYNGGFVNGQLHSSQLAVHHPSQTVHTHAAAVAAAFARPYFHGQVATETSFSGADSQGQASQGEDRGDTGTFAYAGQTTQEGEAAVNPDYTGSDTSVFAYSNNAVNREQGGLIRQFQGPDGNYLIPSGPWGSVGGGFAPGQLALPPPQQPISVHQSYYQSVQPMAPKLDGTTARQSPISERNSPEPLVEINNGGAVKFQTSASPGNNNGYPVAPFGGVDPHNPSGLGTPGMNASLQSGHTQLHSAPPHMQRFHSAPAVPGMPQHNWTQVAQNQPMSQYQDPRGVILRRASADEKWDQTFDPNSQAQQRDAESDCKDIKPAAGTPIKADWRSSSVKADWNNPGYPSVPGVRQPPFRFNSTASASSTTSPLVGAASPNGLPSMAIFPQPTMGGHPMQQSLSHSGYYNAGATSWTGQFKNIAPAMARPFFGATQQQQQQQATSVAQSQQLHSHQQQPPVSGASTPQDQNITLSTPPSKPVVGGIAMRDRQLSGVSAVGLGIASVTFSESSGSDHEGHPSPVWERSDQSDPEEGEDELLSEEDDDDDDDSNDGDFVLGADSKKSRPAVKKARMISGNKSTAAKARRP